MSSLLNLAYPGAAPTQSPTRLMCIILGPVLHQDVAYHIFWKRETCCTAKLVLAWRLALYCSYVVSTNHWHCSRFLAIVLPSQGKITCNVIKDNSNNIVYCEFHCTTNNMSASIFLCHFQINNAISQQHNISPASRCLGAFPLVGISSDIAEWSPRPNEFFTRAPWERVASFGLILDFCDVFYIRASLQQEIWDWYCSNKWRQGKQFVARPIFQ